MSDVKPMFGSAYLYPGLYTPEEALKLKERTPPKLWSFALDVCAGGPVGEFYLANASTVQGALIVNKFGIPAMTLSMAGDDNPVYTVRNWVKHLKLRGKERYKIQSANRSYLLKMLKLHYAEISKGVMNTSNGQLAQAAKFFGAHLNDDTSAAIQVEKLTFQPETAHALLSMLFAPGFTQAQISTTKLVELQDVYDRLIKKLDAKKDYIARAEEMFVQPKWVLGYVPHCDQNLLLVGVATVKPKRYDIYGGEFAVTFERPLSLYRGLEHFYSTHPDDADSVKSALTFCKVHREKTNPNAKILDKEGFIPHGSMVFEDVNSVAFVNGSAGNASPQWLLLSK